MKNPFKSENIWVQCVLVPVFLAAATVAFAMLPVLIIGLFNNLGLFDFLFDIAKTSVTSAIVGYLMTLANMVFQVYYVSCFFIPLIVAYLLASHNRKRLSVSLLVYITAFLYSMVSLSGNIIEGLSLIPPWMIFYDFFRYKYGESYLRAFIIVFIYFSIIVAAAFVISNDKRNNWLRALTSVRLVIFDMDGVLVDSEPAITAAIIQSLNERGIPAVTEDLKSYTGTGDDVPARGIAAKYGHEYDENILKRTYEIYCASINERVAVFPGGKEAIAALKERGIRAALASSAGRERVSMNLTRAGLSESDFDVVMSGSDVEKKKPDPEIFLKTAARAAVPPLNCLVIEDALSGVTAAKAAGMRAAAVTTSFPEAELLAAGADYILENLGGIIKIAGGINGFDPGPPPEKSCGAVLFTKINGERRYVLVISKAGDYGFPKGHVERGESETETALREIREETGVRAEIVHGFRKTIEYTMPSGTRKRVVIFAAEYKNQTPRAEDGRGLAVLPYGEALEAVTFDDFKGVLREAHDWLENLY